MAQETPHTPEAWDAASTGYDRHLADFTGSYAPDLLERLDLSPELEVLEVAAGSGAFTHQIAPLVRRVLATDFSPQMLDRLRARLRKADNVECAVMNGMALEIEDASFDRAVSNFGIMLFDDPQKGMAELRRALEPGGRAVLSGWAGPEDFESFGVFLGAVRQALPDLPRPPGLPPIFSLADPAEFAAKMKAAGFEEVEVDLVERKMTLDSFDELWTRLSASAPPARMLMDRIGPDGARRVRETMDRNLRERFGNGPIELRNVATVGRGVAAG